MNFVVGITLNMARGINKSKRSVKREQFNENKKQTELNGHKEKITHQNTEKTYSTFYEPEIRKQK